MNKQSKIQICHDYFELSGGGENLVATLAKHLDCAMTAGFVNPDIHLSDDYDLTSIKSLAAFRGFRPLQILSLIHHWENYHQADATHMIYSGVYSQMAAKQHTAQKNILYCNTPPRFVYDKKDYYAKQLPVWQRPLLEILSRYLKYKYEASLPLMDVVIANSEHIQRRIKKHLHIDSTVIYPPCYIEHFHWQQQGDYYLSTARLDGLKRVNVIVDAFMKMPDKKLIVASGGSELEQLKSLAAQAKNITFTNWLNSAALQQLINNCFATIYIPKDEDFGISPVESMAAGKPVIGVAEGGLKETIIDQKTGFLLTTGQENSDDVKKGSLEQQLINYVQNLSAEKALAMRDDCEKQAKKFSRQVFLSKMSELIQSV